MSDAHIDTIYRSWASRTQSGITNPVQIEEVRRAFYSGVAAFFYHQLLNIAALPDDKAEDEMASVDRELKEYFASLGATYDPTKGRN